MSLLDNAPAVAHEFENCIDPECRAVLCTHYRAGLAAGTQFIRDTAAGSARARAAVRKAGGEAPEP